MSELRDAAQAVADSLYPTEVDANYRDGSPSAAVQRLRAALAAQPESAGLDVEALDTAMQKYIPGWYLRHRTDLIAAEYTRLTAEKPPEHGIGGTE